MFQLRRATLLIVLALAVFPAVASAGVGPNDHGRRVASVQAFLAGSGYLPWDAVNGRYDYRTEQAVMAFQGWSGLPRDGYAGARTLRALKHARRPVPWAAYHGRRVEVHIDRQVLLEVGANNKVIRAIHVSTGADGKTPRGDFTVFRKEVDSLSVVFNVILPWASYFSGGFAMHSYPDVPGYPASHGCVRMPAPEAQGEYAFATFGIPVHVH